MKKMFLNTMKNVVLLYKNLFHWLISKGIIFLYSILLAFILALPFMLIFFWYTLWSDISWSLLISGFLWWQIDSSLTLTFLEYLPDFIFGVFLIILLLMTAYLAFSYSRVLLISLSHHYILWNKVPFVSKVFWDYKRILKFMISTFLSWLILLTPLVIFIVFTTLLILVFGWLEAVKESVAFGVMNAFSITSIILLVITILISAYLFYRLYFIPYIFAVDYQWDESIWYVLKKSFTVTKGIKNLGKFLVIFITLILLLLPFRYVNNINQEYIEEIPSYLQYKNTTPEIQAVIQKQDPDYILYLETEYKNLSQDVLERKYMQSYILSFIFICLNFIFIYGLVEMVFIEFYRKKIKKIW